MNWPQVPYSEPRYWGSDQLENGHYISRHGPGISFLLVPSYAIGGLYGVLYTMAIFSSLISVLIYKFTSKLTTKKIGLITTIVFSFFTILISHSYKVLSDYPIVLLALASLYFILEKRNDLKYMAIVGCLLGFGAFFKISFYLVDIILLPLIIYLVFKRKMSWKSFLILISFFTLIMILAGIYNLQVYENLIGGSHQNSIFNILQYGYESAPEGTGFTEYGEFRDDSLIDMFFGRYHGLFVLSPIVMLFVLGIKPLWEKDRMLTITILCLAVITIAGYLYVWPVAVVWGIGPALRYFLIIFPLMAIPFACGLQRFSKSWIYWGFFAFLIYFSARLAIGYVLERRAIHSHDTTKMELISSTYRGFEVFFTNLGTTKQHWSHEPISELNILYIVILTSMLFAGAVIPFLLKFRKKYQVSKKN